MPENNKSTPRDVFLQLLSIITLYISVISFIALIFQYVNTLLPDQLDFFSFTNSFNIIRRSLASLIVAWPVYIFISWLIGKDYVNSPAKRDIKIRKWLLYLTLFVAAITIIIDLISLIFNFLGGDLTLAFLLKVLTILIVTSAVFGYYIWDLKRTSASRSDKPRLLAWIVSALLLISLIGGFFIIGSPNKQRARRFDEQRVFNLQNIQSQIINFYQQKERLPENLGELENDITGFRIPLDPETNEPYEYSATTELSYELCVTFNTSSSQGITSSVRPRPISKFDVNQQSWDHTTGRVCFSRDIDPDLLNLDNNRPLLEPIPIFE